MLNSEDNSVFDFPINNLFDDPRILTIQENFSNIIGIDTRIIDAKGTPINSHNERSRLCSKLIRNPIVKNEICNSCLPTFLGGRGVVDKNLSFSCLPGITNFLIPLKINEKVAGYIIFGPMILVMRKPKETYQKIAEELNVDLEDLWSGILELKLVSFQRAQLIVELIKNVSEYILDLSYRNLWSEKDKLLAASKEKLRELSNALLDTAFAFMSADIGSVMLIDKASNELVIEAAREIPEEIAKNARIRIGSGISGIALEHDESFLIDNETQDNRIKSYLHRPQINSSMVIPFKIKNQLLGVINLGLLKTSKPKFTQNSLNQMHKLLDLASAALL